MSALASNHTHLESERYQGWHTDVVEVEELISCAYRSVAHRRSTSQRHQP